MSYLKNTSIAQNYKVSNSTVGEWIKGSLEGKNNLQLETYRGKDRILDNEHNQAEMMRLKEFGAKYRTSSAVKKTVPKKELYEYFDENMLVEVLNGIKTKGKIDYKFFYINPNFWITRYNQVEIPGINANMDSYTTVVNNNYHKISGDRHNIIDLGTGTGEPILRFIDLIGPENCESYTGVDYSRALLDHSEQNVKAKYKNIICRSFAMDLEYSNFAPLYLSSLTNGTDTSSNIIFMTGLTLVGFQNPLQIISNIAKSMFPGDIFVFDYSLDVPLNRHYFSYVKDNKVGFDMYTYLLTLMNVDVNKCEVRYRFDELARARKSFIVIDKDYDIELTLNGKTFNFLIEKDTEIVLWHHKLAKEIEIVNDINAAGLKLLNYTQNKSGKFGTFVTTLNTEK